MGTLLFITKYNSGDFEALRKETLILAIPYVTVFVAIAIDLIAGVMKAKAAGEVRTSFGLRRTVSKFKDYYSLLLVSSMIDVLLSLLDTYNQPFVTFAAGLYLVVIELISIREKWDEKVRRRNNKDIHAVLSVLENRGDLLKAFTEILKRETDEKQTEAQTINQNSGNINTGSVGGDNISINEKGAT